VEFFFAKIQKKQAIHHNLCVSVGGGGVLRLGFFRSILNSEALRCPALMYRFQ